MFENVKYSPSDFAAAYIQTLPHAKKVDEFDNRVEYRDYLEKRREVYFYEYLSMLEYARSFSESNEQSEE